MHHRERDAEQRVAAAIPPEVLAAARELAAAGHRTVLVGGGVRDALLGRPATGHWDLATAARPEEVQALFPNAIPTGLAHGTVTVPLDGSLVEITTFRRESGYSDARRPDAVAFLRELEPDLARRDFTVNAIAYDPQSGRLVDTTGGLADLAAGVLRAVGDPVLRLREDALRALRAARFVSTLGFAVDPATRAALPGVAPLLERLSPERVRDELDRLLLGERPEAGFDLLAESGLLPPVFPELAACRAVGQNRHHRYDVYRHSLETARHAPPRRRVRWAALCHDLGKPETRAVREDGEATFYGHAARGAELTDRRLQALRFPRLEREAIVHLVREHLFDYTPAWSDAAVRRFLRRVGEEHLEDLFDLRRADIAGTGLPGDDASVRALAERIARLRASHPALSVRDLAVDGDDVMRAAGLAPGPAVGRVLARLLDEVLEDPERNQRALLLHRARELSAAEGGADA